MRAMRWWKCSLSAAYMGRPYFRRLSTTNVVSRNGTASRIKGSTNDTTAYVLTAASTATTPIRRPSRFAPQSPMKLEAGGKLWIKKPRAAPAVIAASTPGSARSRSNAMIASVPAMITHTPAASPSTPSDRLTMFIITTRPTTVSAGPAFVAPALGKCRVPTNGNVITFTDTPKCTTITAAAICPTSFTIGGRSKRSSSAPTTVMSAAASNTPCHICALEP
jgi:hypothetical protein